MDRARRVRPAGRTGRTPDSAGSRGSASHPRGTDRSFPRGVTAGVAAPPLGSAPAGGGDTRPGGWRPNRRAAVPRARRDGYRLGRRSSRHRHLTGSSSVAASGHSSSGTAHTATSAISRARVVTAASWSSAGSPSQSDAGDVGLSPRSNGNCRWRLGTLLVGDAPISRLRREGAQQPGDDTAGRQESGERPERGRGRRLRGWTRRQVSPAGRDQRAGAIREQQEEIKRPAPPRPPTYRTGLTFKRMVRSNAGDRGRETLEVGRVTPGRSIGSTTTCCWGAWPAGSATPGWCG
jgi:hypothetical protein